MNKTRDFGEVLEKKLSANPHLEMLVEQQRLHNAIAQLLYDVRTEQGLTQAEVARRAKMHQPAIARVEAADYDGHTINNLHQIAWAMGKRVVIEFFDRRETPASPAIHADQGAVPAIWGPPIGSDRQWPSNFNVQ